MLHKAHTSQAAAVIARKEMERLANTNSTVASYVSFSISSGDFFHWPTTFKIKNVITIAHALTTKQNIRVTYLHLVQTVKASGNSIREFNGTSIVERLYSWAYNL